MQRLKNTLCNHLILLSMGVFSALFLFGCTQNNSNDFDESELFSKNFECQKSKYEIINLPETDSMGDKLSLYEVFYSPVYNSCMFVVLKYLDFSEEYNGSFQILKRYDLFNAFKERSTQGDIDSCLEPWNEKTINQELLSYVQSNPCDKFWENIDYLKTGKDQG